MFLEFKLQLDNMISRRVSTIYFLFLVSVVLATTLLLMQESQGDALAEVHVLDVGQGDSIFIQATNGKQLLIDGGKSSSVLTQLAKVMPRGDRSIDVVIATHPDADHIGGLPLVFERYDVGLFLTSQVSTDTEVFKTLNEIIIEKNIPSFFVRRGMNLRLDDTLVTDFSILFPDRDTTGWDTNTASVVGKLKIGNRGALFTGDSPQSIEKYLIKQDGKNIDIDILKLGHHGSKTSSSEEFLRATSPGLGIISAGAGNRYGHPAKEVVDLIKKLNVPSVSTQDVGTVTLETDGLKWFRK